MFNSNEKIRQNKIIKANRGITLIALIITIIILLALVTISVITYNNNKNTTNTQNIAENIQKNSDINLNTINNTTEDDSLEIENIILYKGIEINKKPGVYDISDMKINNESNKRYNTTYYNYENGKYQGTTLGTFGKETYEGFSIVNNVKKIAMTKRYNAIPRNYKLIEGLPKELKDMADYSSVSINQIDLDGNGKNEYILCYTINYTKGQIGDGESQASSGIMLFDSDYKKVANLVSLENGFWANIKEEDKKVFLSLDDIDYIDIDNDNIMEIIINIPTYEGTKISIIKYNDGIIDGEINIQASVLP